MPSITGWTRTERETLTELPEPDGDESGFYELGRWEHNDGTIISFMVPYLMGAFKDEYPIVWKKPEGATFEYTIVETYREAERICRDIQRAYSVAHEKGETGGTIGQPEDPFTVKLMDRSWVEYLEEAEDKSDTDVESPNKSDSAESATL